MSSIEVLTHLPTEIVEKLSSLTFQARYVAVPLLAKFEIRYARINLKCLRSF